MDTASAASAATNELRICPFLRTADDDGSLGNPILWPDPANRCTALGDAAPQSLRQQEYACLASSHVNCPRFVRGVARVPPAAQVSSGIELTPAIAGALLVLAASFALSVGFVVANGGMSLPGGVSPSPHVAQGSGGPGPSASVEPTTSASSAARTIEPSPEPSPASGVEAETSAPSAPPAATPPAAPTPGPTSDRFALLTPCPNTPDCWIYVVRSGDNLTSIANYFGVALDVVRELNPWTETSGIVAGKELRLPPPTR